MPSRNSAFLLETIFQVQDILFTESGKSHREKGKKKKKSRMQKEMRLKTHNTHPIPLPSCQPLIYNPTQGRQQANSKRSSSKGWLPREASGKSAGMSPSKSSSCERATEVQLPLGLQGNSGMEKRAGAAPAGSTARSALCSSSDSTREGVWYFNPSLHPFLHFRYFTTA